MRKLGRRAAAGICALALCGGMLGAVPASALDLAQTAQITAQAGELKTRNVHIQTDNVSTYESEHFKFYWGNSGADSSRVNESFLAENAKNLEACWDVYMNDLSMRAPTESVNEAFRDGNQYKVNFYIHNTGIKGENGAEIPTDWAYMGYDREGYAFMFCCVDAMQNSPNPSWVLPHEFGHVVTAHQYGWNDNKYVNALWEAIANWYREQFLYSDYYSQWANVNGVTDYFETYMKNLHFTPILGRDNYASWAFLQYLTENPDNLGNYGSDFVKNLMQQGTRDEYPYSEIERIGGADIKDTLGHYAKRLATLDFAHQADYQARQNELLSRGEWNWNQIFTLLEKSTDMENVYTVPTDRAPQQFGVNIIPLEVTGDKISVSLTGLTDVQGADWRACIAVEQNDGTTRYSKLFKAGESANISFGSGDKAAYLTVTATPDSDTWVKNGVAWAYGEGEFDENNAPFLGKTRYPYAVEIEGAGIKQRQDSAAMLQGGYHSNGGGFVAATANVDASVYVGPNARVLGYATVSGNAKIDGYATVTGSANVSGNAVVTGHAVVAENATVKDNAIIGDSAGVMGRSVVSDNARVLESALVYDDYKVSGNATVKGTAFCLAKGAAAGQSMPDGDYYEDSSRTTSAGSIYGWASPDAYVNSRPYNDGQVAGLEFDTDSSALAADTFTSTYGVTAGGSWDAEKTSGKGVLTLAANEYLVADSSYAALHDADYQTAVLIREDGDIFHFGSREKYLSLTTDNGALYLTASDGTKFEGLEVKDAYEYGRWAVISVIITDDEVKVNVNGETKASGTMTIDPVDILSDDATYILGGGGLSMDFFRVSFKEAAEPEYYYTETEDVQATEPTDDTKPTETVWYYRGDLDDNHIIDVYDLGYLKKYVLNGQPSFAAGDCDGDGEVGVSDIIALQKYLLHVDGAGKTGEAVALES